MLAFLDRPERLDREYIARDDEKDRNSEMSAGKEVPDEGKGSKVMAVIVAECIFENRVPMEVVRPELVVVKEHYERSEAS